MAAKTPAQKAAAAKKTVAAANTDLTPVDAQLVQYSPEDLETIGKLREAEVELTLNETSAELAAMLEAIEVADNDGEAEEDADLPTKVAPRFQQVVIDGKPKRFAIHFVHSVNGKSALYNETGTRISPAYGPDDVLPGSEGSAPTSGLKYITKAAVKNNTMRRKSMMPEDYIVG